MKYSCILWEISVEQGSKATQVPICYLADAYDYGDFSPQISELQHFIIFTCEQKIALFSNLIYLVLLTNLLGSHGDVTG